MAERVSIFIEGAPQPFGHFSQVVKFGNSLYISGQLPVDPKTNKLVSDNVDEQAKAVFSNLTAIMQGCQGAVSNIMMMTFYYIDLRDHKAVDKASKDVFFFTPPARTTVQVSALPFGARIMVDAVAVLNPPDLKPGLMV